MSLLPAAPKDTLLSLINANNSPPVPISADNLYFGNPRLDSDGVTSILPTTAMLGREYRGYADFRYRRTNLSVAYDQVPQLHTVGDVSLYKMLPIVNRFLGLNLTTDDVVDTDVSSVGGGEQVNINVVTKAGSLGYTGSMIIRFFRKRPFIWRVVPEGDELLVLRHPIDPAVGKTDLEMIMYRMDFSLFLDTLKIANSYWKNTVLVQQLMRDEYGFNDFPAPPVSGVTDYATKDYPGANPAFQRVIVQKNVVGATYAGNALFHYNLT